MKFIIKAQPEDFIVEELADLPLVESGEYAVFRLTKRGWNTIDVLRILARDLGLGARAFAYGGRKDRHALTSQYITIRSPLCDRIRRRQYKLEFVGYMEHPMSPRLMSGNRFHIVVRGLGEAAVARVIPEIRWAAESGYPNYFDDQRFGSYDTEQGFLGEKALKGHFSGALKIYLTGRRSPVTGHGSDRRPATGDRRPGIGDRRHAPGGPGANAILLRPLGKMGCMQGKSGNEI